MDNTGSSREQITAYLHELKHHHDWTVTQWEAASGVPKQTISRLLQGQVESPQYRTVAQLVISAGGSMDELSGVAPRVVTETEYVSTPETRQLIDTNERSIAYLKEQLRIVQDANRRLQRRITVCHALLCVFLFIFGLLLAWDLLDPQYGFVYRIFSREADESAQMIGSALIRS